MKRFSAFLLAALLLLPSWGLAASTSTSTAAAGSPGVRHYSQLFTLSGSFTPTVPLVYITGCAGGGGGAGGHNANPGAGGGGGTGGQCVSKMPVAVTPGAVLTLTVGIAGVGGAAGANGGVVSTTTSIAGLPIGTYTLLGSGTAAATFGAVDVAGNGGYCGVTAGGTGDTDGGQQNAQCAYRTAGGDLVGTTTGASGGSDSTAGGACNLPQGGYSTGAAVTGAAASGTMGGGGCGGSTSFGVGGAGGSGAVGTTASVGYGGGGGGGAATFAGGNGAPGFLLLEWDE